MPQFVQLDIFKLLVLANSPKAKEFKFTMEENKYIHKKLTFPNLEAQACGILLDKLIEWLRD